MAEEHIEQELVSLSDFLDSVSEADTPYDTWGGRRSHLRQKLGIPVTIQRIGKGGELESPRTEWLQDLSSSGIGLISKYPYEPREIVQVTMCVNGVTWSDRMSVVHRTQSLAGYRFGLTLLDPPKTDDRARKLGSRIGSELATIETSRLMRMKDEITRAVRAYSLARRSLGLLGTSVRRQVTTAIETIANFATAAIDPQQADERRGEPRVPSKCCVSIVVHSVPRWRLIPARVVDISRSGVRVTIPLELDRDMIETELAGPTTFCKGMAVIVGLGSDPDVVWVPAEVVRWTKPDHQTQDICIEFVTPASLRAFGC